MRGEKLASKLGLHYSKEVRCITLCHRTVQFSSLPCPDNRTWQLSNSRHPRSLYQTLRLTFTLGMHPLTTLHLTLCLTTSKLCKHTHTLYPTLCLTTSKLWKHTHTRYPTLCLTASKLCKHTHTRYPTLCLTASKRWKHTHHTVPSTMPDNFWTVETLYQHYTWQLLNCGNTYTWPHPMPDSF